MGVYNDWVFTEAIDQVESLVVANNPEEIASRLEAIAGNQDLSHACLMLLVMKAKGIDTSTKTGIELANAKPGILDLILPPGVKLE
jgi:hypothetical protein